MKRPALVKVRARRRLRRDALDCAMREIDVVLDELNLFESMPDLDRPSGTHDDVSGARTLLNAARGRIETVRRSLP